MFDKKKYHQEYNKAHRDQLNEANKRYRERHRARLAAKTREFHKKNPNYQKEYYQRRGKELARLKRVSQRNLQTNEPQ